MVDLVYSAITWNANICSDFLQAWIKIPATFTDFDQPSSELLNFLLMSQTGVWVRSLPSSAMTSKRSSSSESLATFRLAKLSSFEQLHPPYGLPSLRFMFKQQCHIRRKRCCHVASWLDVICGKQPAPLNFSYTQILCTATCSSSYWTSASAVKPQLFDCV